MSFVGPSAEKVTDGSTIKGHESTLLRSVCLRTCLEPDEWIKDSGCSKHMTGNKSLFSTYKAYDGDNIVFGNNLKGKIIDKVEKACRQAIEEYEKTRADSNNTGGSGSANTGGTVAPDVQGCSYKTFINGKPHSFSGTEGVVGLKRWFEKMEQVFEICKCAEDDKVKFAVCTFESRALTWWNGNVQTLGLANANQIPWSNVKAMMTTEYCPATEIQRMEQELWTLTLKGDDIEAYNNRFHELVLMCPELVSTEKKKIEKYINKKAFISIQRGLEDP
ncbi:putative reverse transcriptase domain-containing protein [Tanacetum coccineum]